MSQKLQKLKEQHAIEEHQLKVNEFTEAQKEETLMFLGKVHAFGAIGKFCTSGEIRALQLFQEEERYHHLGFENFVEFLNSDYSKVTKSQYYERLKLLESEGDARFDLLNEIGVSISTRKLLAAGNYEAITIDNDTLKIGDETADLSNARLVRTLIESYADDCKRLKTEAEKKSAKIEALNKQIETGANQYQKLAKAVDAANGGHPHDIALMRLLAAFHNLKLEAEQLSEEEKSTFAPNIFAEIAAKLDALSRAYNRVPKSTMDMSDDERENFIASKINDDELADLMD